MGAQAEDLKIMSNFKSGNILGVFLGFFNLLLSYIHWRQFSQWQIIFCNYKYKTHTLCSCRTFLIMLFYIQKQNQKNRILEHFQHLSSHFSLCVPICPNTLMSVTLQQCFPCLQLAVFPFLSLIIFSIRTAVRRLPGLLS